MSTLKTTNIAHPSSASNNIVLDSSGNATLATAKITTLADSAGSNTSTPAEIASGRAKAWVNFNGTGTVAIRASYNVSSITDNGVGDYTVNFATALADANYCATSSFLDNSGYYVIPVGGGFAKTASSYRPGTVAKNNNGGTWSAYTADFPFVDIAIFR